MPDNPKPAPLTSQDAVRLARFGRPEIRWSDKHSKRMTAHQEGTARVFRVSSLNDLALAEQRVVAAGLGGVYVESLSSIVRPDAVYEDFIPDEAVTATAEQRARALLALLDAHPELEKPQ